MYSSKGPVRFLGQAKCPHPLGPVFNWMCSRFGAYDVPSILKVMLNTCKLKGLSIRFKVDGQLP